MQAAEAEFLTTKKKELFLFDNRLFRVTKKNSNVYYLCNTGTSMHGRLINKV